ncbi:MAG: hypothetical protein M0P69_01550 [Bacteroidales bacterium]|nr:hypothetical protein [Bacteroidales bacterium]
MEGILKLWEVLQANQKEILDAVAYLVLFASVIVKLTPTLKDDNYFKPIIKFIGKYIALDKYSPKDEE